MAVFQIRIQIKNLMKSKSNFLVVIAACIALSACGGKKLDGSYGQDNLGVVLAFKPNGKAVYMGMAEVDYEVDGNDVKLHIPGQPVLILKILEDGSIQFPLLGKLKRVPS